jgi:hypothetical protein
MKLQDKETLNVAQAVKDVLEGKKPAVEEMKYPHTMYHPETGEEETATNEEEHKALSAKGYTHEKKESPEEPKAKGEKDFKDKHVVKKTGVDTKGVVTKESVEDDEEVADPLPEITPPGTAVDTEIFEAKFSPALIKKAIAIANSKKYKDYYSGAYRAIEKLKKGLEDDPQVLAALKAANEGVEKDVKKEESDKQKKYQAFFQKALKKFGVDSPAELEGDKKKEFFDYVDKNYEADNEED